MPPGLRARAARCWRDPVDAMAPLRDRRRPWRRRGRGCCIVDDRARAATCIAASPASPMGISCKPNVARPPRVLARSGGAARFAWALPQPRSPSPQACHPSMRRRQPRERSCRQRRGGDAGRGPIRGREPGLGPRLGDGRGIRRLRPGAPPARRRVSDGEPRQPVHDGPGVRGRLPVVAQRRRR